jgi:hypothetical protein
VVCECVTTIVEIQDLLVHSQRRAHAGVLVSCDVCGRVSGVSCVAAVCRRPSVSAVGRVLAAADAMHISVLFQRRPASFAFSELMEFVVRARFRGSRSDVRPDSPLSHIYIIAGVLCAHTRARVPPVWSARRGLKCASIDHQVKEQPEPAQPESSAECLPLRYLGFGSQTQRRFVGEKLCPALLSV